MARLDGKVAIITGAGSGIGRATSLRFAQEGAGVVVNDIVPSAAEQTVDAIRAAGGTAHLAPGDVTEADVNEALVDRAVERFGKLDILHCNAGGAKPMPLFEISELEYRAQIALNLDAVWFGSRAALRVMAPQGSGAILVTSSGAGLGATWGLPAYGAAKAGAISLMRSIALEFGAVGVRANAISPGPMATPALLSVLNELPGGAESYGTQIPLGRLGTAEDVAEAAVFLASDEARYVSGVVLPVDGAIHSTLAAPKSF